MVLAVSHLLLNDENDFYELEFVSIYTQTAKEIGKYRQDFKDYKDKAILVYENKGNIIKKSVEYKKLNKEEFDLKSLQKIIKEMIEKYFYTHGTIMCNFKFSDIGVNKEDENKFFSYL